MAKEVSILDNVEALAATTECRASSMYLQEGDEITMEWEDGECHTLRGPCSFVGIRLRPDGGREIMVIRPPGWGGED